MSGGKWCLTASTRALGARCLGSNPGFPTRKKCSWCGRIQGWKKFPQHGKRLFSHCLECQRKYSRAHYKKNKDKHIARKAAYVAWRRDAVRDMIRNAKAVPCTDCKKEYPYYVMDLDHVRGKSFGFGTVLHGKWRSVSALESELAKCEPVCSNCHRERTYTRRFQHKRVNRLEVSDLTSEGQELFSGSADTL